MWCVNICSWICISVDSMCHARGSSSVFRSQATTLLRTDYHYHYDYYSWCYTHARTYIRMNIFSFPRDEFKAQYTYTRTSSLDPRFSYTRTPEIISYNLLKPVLSCTCDQTCTRVDFSDSKCLEKGAQVPTFITQTAI